MSLSTQPYKGARDFYPEDKRIQKYIFGKLRQVVESFGYEEYDAPILEPVDIYAAKSGQELVDEQLYSFEDKGGRKVALRPEMTPSVSRMVAARRQELVYPLRLYSIPNLWRYERPQKGRLREHWQLNVDLFGEPALAADHEIIFIADSILKALGAKPEMYQININSRLAMVAAMKEFNLEETELKRVYKIVDKMPKLSKGEFDQLLAQHISNETAQKLRELLESKTPPKNVQKLLDTLKASGVESAVYEPSVVRGLEYYTDIVFEVFANHPDLSRAMFGGGRYNGLVEIFGVEPLPVTGFGMGDVMIEEFLRTHDLLPKLSSETQVVAILVGEVYEQAQPLLAKLRRKMNVAVDSTDRKIDNKIRAAEKAGVKEIIFIGKKEIASNTVRQKDLSSGKDTELQL